MYREVTRSFFVRFACFVWSIAKPRWSSFVFLNTRTPPSTRKKREKKKVSTELVERESNIRTWCWQGKKSEKKNLNRKMHPSSLRRHFVYLWETCVRSSWEGLEEMSWTGDHALYCCTHHLSRALFLSVNLKGKQCAFKMEWRLCLQGWASSVTFLCRPPTYLIHYPAWLHRTQKLYPARLRLP